jgi:hypothetical protein
MLYFSIYFVLNKNEEFDNDKISSNSNEKTIYLNQFFNFNNFKVRVVDHSLCNDNIFLLATFSMVLGAFWNVKHIRSLGII